MLKCLKIQMVVDVQVAVSAPEWSLQCAMLAAGEI